MQCDIFSTPVFNESIIKSNEHPKFKIGDKVNNGKIVYKVLGFNRNALGNLCYVFENNISGKFAWICEQVDKYFILCDLNNIDCLEKINYELKEIVKHMNCINQILDAYESNVKNDNIKNSLLDYFKDFHLPTFNGLKPKDIVNWLENLK